jgi:tryptophanyl-tRNA synthetase
MTQYKDKSNKQEKANGTQMIPTGLLVYPPLMAADILLYDADLVPVGKDQKQHVELTRDLAIKFNKKYGETFNLPEYYATKETAVIYDLVSPEHKMSKSNPVKGTIFLTDSVEEITKKITASITDCDNKVIFDEKKLGTKLGGISNLMIIYKLLTNMDYKDQEAKFANIKNYGEFKKEVIAEVVSFLTKFQKEYKNAQDNIESLKKQIEKNAEICREISNKKIEDVYKKIGVK